MLLRGALQRELAMMDAARKAGRHSRDSILAIDADEVGKRSEQGGVSESFGLDAVVQCFFPSVEDVPERCLSIRIGS
jgi:hypothetical protein